MITFAGFCILLEDMGPVTFASVTDPSLIFIAVTAPSAILAFVTAPVAILGSVPATEAISVSFTHPVQRTSIAVPPAHELSPIPTIINPIRIDTILFFIFAFSFSFYFCLQLNRLSKLNLFHLLPNICHKKTPSPILWKRRFSKPLLRLVL